MNTGNRRVPAPGVVAVLAIALTGIGVGAANPTRSSGNIASAPAFSTEVRIPTLSGVDLGNIGNELGNGAGFGNIGNGTGTGNIANGIGFNNTYNGTGTGNIGNGNGVGNSYNGTGSGNIGNGNGVGNSYSGTGTVGLGSGFGVIGGGTTTP